MRRQLTTLSEDPDNFAAEFDHWKSLGVAGEYSSYLFGKDSSYIAPGGLEHVHLVPLEASALVKWDIQWRRRSRKVSDRALVYASDQTHGHLLIYILGEPTAHEVALMRTPEHQTLMRKLSLIAKAFIERGAVIG